MYLKELCI